MISKRISQGLQKSLQRSFAGVAKAPGRKVKNHNIDYGVYELEQYNQHISRLDPYKHTYMHWSFNDSYDSYFTLGEYPVPNLVAQRGSDDAYQNASVDVVFSWLQENVEGFNLTLADFEQVQHHSWQVYDVEIDTLKYSLLSALADGINIRESKFRPNVERRRRERLSRL